MTTATPLRLSVRHDYEGTVVHARRQGNGMPIGVGAAARRLGDGAKDCLRRALDSLRAQLRQRRQAVR